MATATVMAAKAPTLVQTSAYNSSFVQVKSVAGYSRRQLLFLLSAGTASALATAYWNSVCAETPLNIPLPENKNPDNPSFDVFMALSQLVTLRENLNDEAGKHIYRLIIDEPWGKQHISQAYAALKQNTFGIKPDKNISWFISHLLTTWYLGIYYHQDKITQRVTYEHALMFDAVRSFYPAPLIMASGYGTWTLPVSTKLFQHE